MFILLFLDMKHEWVHLKWTAKTLAGYVVVWTLFNHAFVLKGEITFSLAPLVSKSK